MRSCFQRHEHEQILNRWNHTETLAARDEWCIHELFESQAMRAPEAIALEFGDERISYRELNERARSIGALFDQLWTRD